MNKRHTEQGRCSSSEFLSFPKKGEKHMVQMFWWISEPNFKASGLLFPLPEFESDDVQEPWSFDAFWCRNASDGSGDCEVFMRGLFPRLWGVSAEVRIGDDGLFNCCCGCSKIFVTCSSCIWPVTSSVLPKLLLFESSSEFAKIINILIKNKNIANAHPNPLEKLVNSSKQ